MQHACLQQIKLIKILLLARIVEENNEVALCPAIQSIILKLVVQFVPSIICILFVHKTHVIRYQ
jgi:hypothetical protein